MIWGYCEDCFFFCKGFSFTKERLINTSFFVPLKRTFYQPIEWGLIVDRNEFDFNAKIHSSIKSPFLIREI